MKRLSRAFIALTLALAFTFIMAPACFAAELDTSSSPTVTILKHPGGSSTYNSECGTPYTSTWFSVRALGVASYRWQIRYPGTETWYDIPEPDVTEEWTDGIILTIKLHLRTHQDIVDHVGCWYRCVLRDVSGAETITDAATIVDNPPVYTPDPYVGPPCPPPCPPCEPCYPIIIAPSCPYSTPTTPITVTTTTTATTTITTTTTIS